MSQYQNPRRATSAHHFSDRKKGGSVVSAEAPIERGKVAEIAEGEKAAMSHVYKGLASSHAARCPVDTVDTPHTPRTHITPTTKPAHHKALSPHLRSLLDLPETQQAIASARQHRKRIEARQATMQARREVPQVSWKRATPEQKFRFAGHAAEAFNGHSFTLKLSRDKQAKLMRHQNPLRALTDTINRQLKQHDLSGMPYALALELSGKEVLHVHGFLIPPDDAHDAVRRALRAAGGEIAGKAAGRQLSLKKLSGAGAWVHYCGKDHEKTDEVLSGDARLFQSKSMRQAAREFSLSKSNL